MTTAPDTTGPAGSPTPFLKPTTGRVPVEEWAAVREKSAQMGAWQNRAVELAAAQDEAPEPGLLAQWRGRRAARKATRSAANRASARLVSVHPTTLTTPSVRSAGWLRFIPPVAALGTAWVLQVVAMTDIVGTPLAAAAGRSDLPWLADRPEVGYLAAMLLGVAVASCAEGGAAYLMDLYDKHLMARDSVWVLRLAMIGYVAASAGVIHWWLAQRHLPSVVSWLLAGMSASALFLWSRGSRWRHRAAMRDAGQLDPAMPRLPMAAKVMHPIRWFVTLWLVSWTPAATPDEARARYEEWSADRAARRAAARATREAEEARRREADGRTGVPAGKPTTRTDDARQDPSEATSTGAGNNNSDEPDTVPDRSDTTEVDHPDGSAADPQDDPEDPDDADPDDHGPTAIADAASIRRQYGDRPPGRNELHRVHGGHRERWSKALRAYNDRADLRTAASAG